MKLKQGVTITGIRPELILGLMVADTVLRENGIELVVTSITDSVHSFTSLHYAGAAADIRIWDMDDPQKIISELKSAITSDFDVILEKDHIHLEWQPRRPGK